MKLINDIANILREVESVLGMQLTDEDFADGRDEIVHIFLHEACHAAVSNRVPWIHELNDNEHTVLDEVLARLLEGEIGLGLGLTVHTPEECVRELRHYPVKITLEQYECLQAEWQQRYWPLKDIEGIATYALIYLRQEGVMEH